LSNNLTVTGTTTQNGVWKYPRTPGAGKVLTSDASGNASWTDLVPGTTNGTISSANRTFTAAYTYSYLGMYVSVPPGKSQVYVGGMVGATDMSGHVTFTLSTSSSSASSTTGFTLVPRLAGFPIHKDAQAVGQATFFVNNTGTANITLYLWGYVGGGSSTATWVLSGVSEPFIFVAH
ncbi:hypothetical protein, partial [Dysgonomonas macrotermitis]